MTDRNGAALRRLKHLRDLDGLTTAEAAEIFGVPKSTYIAIERGTRTGNLDPSRVGYSIDRLRHLSDMSEPQHRQRASIPTKVQRSNKEQLRLAGEILADLRSLYPKSPKVSVERLTAPSGPSDIDEMAEECRYMLGLGPDEPIGNLTAAIERAGVCLTPVHNDIAESSKRVDGLSSWIDDQPAIGINPDSAGDRFRLTLGHELGHLLMHRRPSETAEAEANQFASALLIPTEQFLAAIDRQPPTLRTFVGIKHEWGISIAAGIYRARELEIVDQDRFRSLQIQIAKWRRNEPGAFEIRPGRLLPRMVETAGGTAAVARELGVSDPHVVRTIDWESHRRKGLKLIPGTGTEPASMTSDRAVLRSV